MGVLQFAFDAAGDGRPAVGQGGDEADNHFGLVDEQKIACVGLAVNVAFDLANLVEVQPDGFAARLRFRGNLCRPRRLQGPDGAGTLLQGRRGRSR